MNEVVNLATIGAGMVTIGAAIGIGWIASNAMNALARQPEAAPKIQTNMLIAAAFIEGVALFCAVVCFMAK